MASTPASRRSQAERSAATREALLNAALECLVEDGYANTTTARVAERAGLSRGAHLHHFQTRDTLLAAAADHLTRRRGEHLIRAVEALPASGPDRVAQGLDLIFDSYNNPLYQATLDLWTNARTDEELRAHLVPIERQLDRQTMELSRRLFPDVAERPDFERLVELALAAIRGLVVLDTLHADGERAAKQWPACRDQLAALFASAATPGAR
ncbi:MAG TPA: TetR/AcrR family transcriptional regulator [Baekduia sp.]